MAVQRACCSPFIVKLEIIRSTVPVPYREALERQRQLHHQRVNGEIHDTLWLLEHFPVITTGLRKSQERFLRYLPEDVEVVATERGGQITYHGPGQLMGYIFTDMNNHKLLVRRFVYNIEEAIICYLARNWQIQARHDEEHTGVWVGMKKIAAIGIALKQRVTFHGFAFNVNTNISHFDWIIPCGISDSSRGVTSLSRILGRNMSIYNLIDDFVIVFRDIMGYNEA